MLISNRPLSSTAPGVTDVGNAPTAMKMKTQRKKSDDRRTKPVIIDESIHPIEHLLKEFREGEISARNECRGEDAQATHLFLLCS